MNPNKIFSWGRLASGTVFGYVNGCDFSLFHHHLELIVNDHLSRGDWYGHNVISSRLRS